jgi:RNA-directed DNA polymerase
MTVLRSPKRKHMQIRKAEQHMQTSLRGIANKAKVDSRHRFGNLYSLLNERNLHWCFPQMNRKASPGVDAVDYETYKSELDSNISRTVSELKGSRYRAKLVRRRYIPKTGGKRPLGIPVVGDKLLQTAGAQILSAIYENNFLEFSHGYRRGKSPQKAALELSKRIQRGRYGWIVDADIRKFFDSMDHEWMMKMLEQRINDRRFLGLIKKWLKAGILEEDGQVIYPVTGTPQGGVVSAVLANIYLHYALDIWFEKVVKPRCKGDVIMMRYADDFVCCFQYKEEAQYFYEALVKRLGKFKLELSKEKTRIIKFTRFETKNSERFVFLGFEYSWGVSREGKPLVKMRTSRKKFQTSISTFLAWIKGERSNLGTSALFRKVKEKLQGHFNYYGVCGNSEMLNRFYQKVLEIMYKWLNRRSQRKSCNWQGFKEMVKFYEIPRPRIIGYWNITEA